MLLLCAALSLVCLNCISAIIVDPNYVDFDLVNCNEDIGIDAVKCIKMGLELHRADRGEFGAIEWFKFMGNDGKLLEADGVQNTGFVLGVRKAPFAGPERGNVFNFLFNQDPNAEFNALKLDISNYIECLQDPIDLDAGLRNFYYYCKLLVPYDELPEEEI